MLYTAPSVARTDHGPKAKAAEDVQLMKLLKAGKAFKLLAGCEVKLCSAACRCKGESWDTKRQWLTAHACGI